MSSLHSVRDSGRTLLRTAVVGAALTALVLGSAGAALAAPGDVSTSEDTQINVVVGGVITLSGLTQSLTFTGVPGDLITGTAAYTVETNNVGGYAVTVTANGPALVPAVPAVNTDTISWGEFAVSEGSTSAGTLDNSPLQVHTQAFRSAAGGDDLTTDFTMTVPFVNEDTYTGTVTYVATAL